MNPTEKALIEAVTAALPILVTDRETTVESEAAIGADGKPDLSTLGEAAAAYVAEYDNAIALCEDALRKAGLR